MTQIIAFLLAGLLCFGVTGCSRDKPEPSVPDNEPVEQTQPDIEEPPEPDPVPLTQPLPETKPETKPAPAPDFALMVDQPVSTVSEKISVHFVNNTGKEGWVLSIPHLERLSETGEWVEVPWNDNIGFCGTPDPLPVEGRDWSENVPLLWGALEEGTYRLSYKAGQGAESEEELAYGEFIVSAPELCGYPTAEYFAQLHLED